MRLRAPLILGVVLVAPAAQADDKAWLDYIARSHTIALIEAGIIVLPNAPVSQSTYGGDVPFTPVGQGDATIQLGIHILYRPWRDWAFGANFFFDPRPTSDTEYGGLSGLSRTHSRSYFFIGGEARYIPLHARAIEGWIGAQTGVVIIADRFTTNAGSDKPAIFGDREVSLSTEGFFFGGQVGLDWYITDRLVAGLVFRYNHWILPEQPKCSPILDCTTLTGGVDSIDFGFTLGYRISL
jgi:hypothetical protein